ncbi:MAG: site-2 protease family protein [Phycisphaerae bacterium]|nr:site-2 protease family protein [Phycisphaerae bacterium]
MSICAAIPSEISWPLVAAAVVLAMLMWKLARRRRAMPPPPDAPPQATVRVYASDTSEELAVPTLIYAATPRPIAPVASPLASVAWILAIPVMLPLVGIFPAVALAVVSILLLVNRNPLPHDRRVGKAGLVLAGLSVVFLAATVSGIFQFAEFAPPASNAPVPATAPATQAVDGIKAGTDVPEPAPADMDGRTSTKTGTRLPGLYTVLVLAILIGSIIFHEIGHAVAACWGGDPTARDQGRFSLNPIRHLSLVGSFIVPMVLILLPGDGVIGWAKPVPVRLDRLRNRRRGHLGVTLAGVSMNALLALIATNLIIVLGVVLQWIYPPPAAGAVWAIPMPDLWFGVMEACAVAVFINILLAAFNLLPIPPLDGFGVIQALAPEQFRPAIAKVSQSGMILLLLLIAFNVLDSLFIGPMLVAEFLNGFAYWVIGWA